MVLAEKPLYINDLEMGEALEKQSLDLGVGISYISGMADHIEIIRRLGGIRPLAKAMGIPHTTVQSWSDSGKIPKWRREAVLVAASKAGLCICIEDFGPIDQDPPPPEPEGEAA